jgi:hypothetical protein
MILWIRISLLFFCFFDEKAPVRGLYEPGDKRGILGVRGLFWGQTLVLHILGVGKGILGFGLFSPHKSKKFDNKISKTDKASSISISYYIYISIQGGGYIGGYIGYMGFRGIGPLLIPPLIV